MNLPLLKVKHSPCRSKWPRTDTGYKNVHSVSDMFLSSIRPIGHISLFYISVLSDKWLIITQDFDLFLLLWICLDIYKWQTLYGLQTPHTIHSSRHSHSGGHGGSELCCIPEPCGKGKKCTCGHYKSFLTHDFPFLSRFGDHLLVCFEMMCEIKEQLQV